MTSVADLMKNLSAAVTELDRDLRAIERRQRGRLREFDGPPVSVRLPAALHDALSREALRRGEPLSDVIRERLFVSQKADSGQDS